jgi:hypothetical protein
VIIDWLLNAVQAVLVWLSGLFPGGTPWTTGPDQGWDAALNHLADLNYFLPIAEVFAFTLGCFLVFPALAGISLLVWLVAIIRGGSARG